MLTQTWRNDINFSWILPSSQKDQNPWEQLLKILVWVLSLKCLTENGVHFFLKWLAVAPLPPLQIVFFVSLFKVFIPNDTLPFTFKHLRGGILYIVHSKE